MRANCECARAYGPHWHCNLCDDPVHPSYGCTRCVRMSHKLGTDGLEWLEKVLSNQMDRHIRNYHTRRGRK